MGDILNAAEQKIPEVLYYYCSVPEFYNIVSNRKIFLDDIAQSNDSEELQYFKTRICSFIQELLEQYLSSPDDESNIVPDPPNDIVRNSLAKYLHGLLETEQYKHWCLRLSENQDDLGQWRGYASDGEGVAIGFNAMPFFLLGQLANANKTPFDFCFQKIRYGEAFVEDLRSYTNENVQLTKEAIPAVYVLSALMELAEKLMPMAPWFKNAGFSEEQEWRLIYSKKIKDLLSGQPFRAPEYINCFSEAIAWKEMDYDCRSDVLLSRAVFSINTEKMISEITIGPKCKLTENDVKLFLIKSGFSNEAGHCDIKISKSESTYR